MFSQKSIDKLLNPMSGITSSAQLPTIPTTNIYHTPVVKSSHAVASSAESFTPLVSTMPHIPSSRTFIPYSSTMQNNSNLSSATSSRSISPISSTTSPLPSVTIDHELITGTQCISPIAPVATHSYSTVINSTMQSMQTHISGDKPSQKIDTIIPSVSTPTNTTSRSSNIMNANTAAHVTYTPSFPSRNVNLNFYVNTPNSST